MSGPTPPSQDTRFLTRLESVRGCAAIMVAMTHCFAIFPYASDQYPLQAALQLWVHILFQGTSALITFFVISGYVLSISLDRSETNFRNILIFYMRRIFRIFPAHIVWMFIALALLIFVYVPHTNPVADGWFNNMNSGPMNLTIFVMNLALVITSLIPGEWTLTLELIVYLIYPLMYVIYKRGGVSGNILLLIFLMACSYQFGDIRLLHYLIAFYWGLATPNLYKRFIERISDRTGTVLLWTSIVLLLVFPILQNTMPFATLMVQLVTGGYLIFCCIFMKRDRALFRFLDGDRIQRMGQISYSFYVSHFLINYWVAYVLFRLVGFQTAGEIRFLFMSVVAVLSITIAHKLSSISYEKIEAPTMKYSSDLSKRLRKRSGEAKAADAGTTDQTPSSDANTQKA